jgi:hypothetical protein
MRVDSFHKKVSSVGITGIFSPNYFEYKLRTMTMTCVVEIYVFFLYLSEDQSVKRLSERAQSTMTPISWTEPPDRGTRRTRARRPFVFNVADSPKFRPQNTKGAE